MAKDGANQEGSELMLEICTREHPYSHAAAFDAQGNRVRWQHPDAVMLYEEYNGLSGGGDFERYKCPHCGLTFWVELPD